MCAFEEDRQKTQYALWRIAFLLVFLKGLINSFEPRFGRNSVDGRIQDTLQELSFL